MSRAGLFRSLAWIVALCGVVVITPACELGVEGADYPVAYGAYPDGCIATTDSVYYNGYANYWCGGVWYFRGEGGRWGHYDREPPGLYGRRAQGAPARRTYEHVSRPSRGGGGAGRGGHR
jgi:hypothetical protein